MSTQRAVSILSLPDERLRSLRLRRRECNHCGKAYIAKRDASRFCLPKCRRAAYRKQHPTDPRGTKRPANKRQRVRAAALVKWGPRCALCSRERPLEKLRARLGRVLVCTSCNGRWVAGRRRGADGRRSGGEMRYLSDAVLSGLLMQTQTSEQSCAAVVPK